MSSPEQSPLLWPPCDEEVQDVQVARESLLDRLETAVTALEWMLNPKGAGRKQAEVRSASYLYRDLVRIMQEENISISHIARKVGYNANSIGRWKSGRAAPSLIAAESIAEVLGYEIVLRRKS